MSRHLLTGLLLFLLSALIMAVYAIAALVPGALAYLLGMPVERVQFTLVFIPVALLMMGLSVAIGYVAYSILLEARENERKARREERER